MIAKLFKAVSLAEAVHIKNHLQALEKITNESFKIDDIVSSNDSELLNSVNTTRNNLIQAISGETYEFKKMYKGYIKNARQEDIYLAEFSFNLARKAEKVHCTLFTKYLKLLESGRDVSDIGVYLCKICGNVELSQLPLICPNCGHDQQFFDEIKL